jgi:hypothetical protein
MYKSLSLPFLYIFLTKNLLQRIFKQAYLYTILIQETNEGGWVRQNTTVLGSYFIVPFTPSSIRNSTSHTTRDPDTENYYHSGPHHQTCNNGPAHSARIATPATLATHTHAPHYQANKPPQNSTIQEEEEEEEEEEEDGGGGGGGGGKKSIDSHINVSKTTTTFSMPSQNSSPGACSAHQTTRN